MRGPRDRSARAAREPEDASARPATHRSRARWGSPSAARPAGCTRPGSAAPARWPGRRLRGDTGDRARWSRPGRPEEAPHVRVWLPLQAAEGPLGPGADSAGWTAGCPPCPPVTRPGGRAPGHCRGRTGNRVSRHHLGVGGCTRRHVQSVSRRAGRDSRRSPRGARDGAGAGREQGRLGAGPVPRRDV